MAFENPKNPFTGTANSDLRAKQYRGVKLIAGADRLVDIAGVGAPYFWGVTQNKAGLGEDVTVARGGITKMEAGAVVAHPSYVTTDAQGRAIVATTGVRYIGTTLLGAAAAGEIISVDLDQTGVAP